jgi:4-amino-4-deoxy-L-arabinose transferase-like glycosyltransferase
MIRWRSPVILSAIVCVYLVLAGAQADTARPWFDEAIHAGPAVDLVTRGVMGYPIGEPCRFTGAPGWHNRMYQTMPLSHIGPAVWYKLVGFGVLRMRWYAILWGLVTLLSWGYITRILMDSWTPGILAMVLLATDHVFIDGAASGRPDMTSAGLAALGLLSYLLLRERRLGVGILVSQAFFCTSFFTHPVGALPVFLLLFLVVKLDFRRLRWNYLWLAAAPYVVGFGLWGWYISQDFANFRLQFLGYNAAGRQEGITHPFASFYHEFTGRYAGVYLPPYATGIRRITIIIPLVFACAVAGLLFRRQKGRLLGMMAVVLFVVFSLLEPKKYPFYLLPMAILLCCATGTWLWQEWTAGNWRRWAATGMFTGVVLLQVGWTLYACHEDPYHHSYLRVIAYLNHNAGPKSLIMGDSELAFGRGFYSNLIADSTLGYCSGKHADFIVVSFNGFAELFKVFASEDAGLDHYVHQTLAEDYRRVYADRIYTIYQRRY